MQFEQAAVKVIQNLHGVNEDGSTPHFSVQVLMNSSQQFGPSSLRELSVRLASMIAEFNLFCVKIIASSAVVLACQHSKLPTALLARGTKTVNADAF